MTPATREKIQTLKDLHARLTEPVDWPTEAEQLLAVARHLQGLRKRHGAAPVGWRQNTVGTPRMRRPADRRGRWPTLRRRFGRRSSILRRAAPAPPPKARRRSRLARRKAWGMRTPPDAPDAAHARFCG